MLFEFLLQLHNQLNDERLGLNRDRPADWQVSIDGKILLCYFESMKVTVEFPDSEIAEICRVTGERKKGPAIRKLVADALRMKRRELLAEKFISGEWGVDLKGFEAAQAAERQADAQRDESRRG